MHTQVEFAVKHFGMMRSRATSATSPPPAISSRTTHSPPGLRSRSTWRASRTNNPQRDNDLRGSYFLELDKYPTVTFKSTRVESAGKDRYTVTGDLTIKGITKPVTLQMQRYGEMNDERLGHRIAFSAEGEINRHDYGMEFDSWPTTGWWWVKRSRSSSRPKSWKGRRQTPPRAPESIHNSALLRACELS